MSRPPRPFTAFSTSSEHHFSLVMSPGKRHRSAPFCFDQLDDLLGVCLLARQIRDRDIRSFAGECDRCRTTDAGVAAGYQRTATAQTTVTDIALLAVVGYGLHLGVEAGNLLRLLRERRTRILVSGILHRR